AKESTVNRITIQSTANVRIDGFSLNDPGGVPLVDQLNHADTIANNIVLPGADEGVELLEDKLTTVSNNEIESAVLDGINVSGSKSAPLNDTVQGNEVLNTSLDGINLFDANGVVVKGNLVQGSRSVGLTVSQSTDVNAANNLLVANSGGAIFSESAFDRLQGNTVEFNQTDGIDVEGDHGDVILKNSVFGNATSGLGNAIFLSNVSGGEAVKNNSVLQNHSNGIEVFSTSAKGVKVTGNTVENNGGDGGGLGGTSNITVAANVLNNNRSVGILLDAKSAGNTVTENTALGNGVFDAEDLSTGTGTAGTANLWTRNRFNRDNRGGGLGH
ncbi:MAG: right-handed parallel beta-helix repeat-containing protein, partial [Isosphaeraceae bacterium]